MYAIYARQSLDVKDSISIEMQIEMCKRMFEQGKEYQVYSDKGFSGKNTNRPAFNQLMNDLKEGKISTVIVYRLDRFSRSLLDFSVAWEEMSKNHVDFISVNEKFDTSTPMGTAMLFIIMVFAQLERETIAERIKDNYYTRIKRGAWPGGPAPFGWENAEILCNGYKIPILSQNKNIDLVKKAYRAYAYKREKSLGALAREFADATGERWTNVRVKRLLRNPINVKANADVYVYYKTQGVDIQNPIEEFNGNKACILVGKRNGNDRKRNPINKTTMVLAAWEGIVDSETWLTCQERLDDNEPIADNKEKGKYSWLAGVMKCGKCGSGLRILPYRTPGTIEVKRLRMSCIGHIDHICDHIVDFDADEVEQYVQPKLEKLLDRCKAEPLYKKDIQKENDVKIELLNIEKKIENLVSCIASGNADADTITYINKEIKKLNEQKKGAEKRFVASSIEINVEKMDFCKLLFEEKKLVARTFIEKVIVNENRTLEIVFKI